jgi:hypothetical protein
MPHLRKKKAKWSNPNSPYNLRILFFQKSKTAHHFWQAAIFVGDREEITDLEKILVRTGVTF